MTGGQKRFFYRGLYKSDIFLEERLSNLANRVEVALIYRNPNPNTRAFIPGFPSVRMLVPRILTEGPSIPALRLAFFSLSHLF